MRYEPCINITEMQRILEQRLTNVDFETNPPTEIIPHRAAYFRSFPLLDTVVLNKEPAQRYVTIVYNILLNSIYSLIIKFINLTILFYAFHVVYFGKKSLIILK